MRKLMTAVIVLLIIVTVVSYYYSNHHYTTTLATRAIESPETPSLLKVVTYNIRHGEAADGRVRLDLIADILARSGADIIGLNEVDSHMIRSGFRNQVKFLAHSLHMYYAFGPAINRGVGSYGNALLSTFPLTGINNQILPGGKGTEPRGILTARIKPDGRSEYSIMITHLALNQEVRVKQLSWIDDYLSGLGGSFILMGDFNTRPDQVLTYPVMTSELETYPARQPEEELDYFISNLGEEQLKNCRVVTGGEAAKASDHLPLVIQLGLPGQA